jgi:multicomponent Na+:H+ antiporter subunit C
MTVVLAATAAALFGIGTYLVLQHTLSRIIIGLALIAHGGNVLLMASGRRGAPPIVGSADPDTFADPLAQALALTAIVITFGVSAFLLALAYRSWILTQEDEVQDDVADRTILRLGHPDKEVADEEVPSDSEDEDPPTPQDLDVVR